jgi:hypothetical protein
MADAPLLTNSFLLKIDTWDLQNNDKNKDHDHHSIRENKDSVEALLRSGDAEDCGECERIRGR